ncbi:hypothetical protein VVD49_07340 [Uliginosibacterium sp. H3]|uniref:HEPN domain-containing protein n=1 Tax=Uliginosibacterium silvisoli TaxID=3114758 RepID=A0ABU6K0S5_9RHOO|nr:hypothetical protein [Uliginosibacterium sp. H3]
MEVVAQYLRQEALSRASPERDTFGRSAFNRYYYATFLTVKRGISALRPEWAGNIPHADIPNMLRGAIKESLGKGRKRALRAGDFELENLCARAISAAEDLAKVMEQGKATRVAADYHPDILVDFSGEQPFYLNKVSVHVAKDWPFRARAFLDTISQAWMQVDERR